MRRTQDRTWTGRVGKAAQGSQVQSSHHGLEGDGEAEELSARIRTRLAVAARSVHGVSVTGGTEGYLLHMKFVRTNEGILEVE